MIENRSVEAFFYYEDNIPSVPVWSVILCYENENIEKYLSEAECIFLRQSGFKGKKGQFRLLPHSTYKMCALVGIGEKKDTPSPFHYSDLAKYLPSGVWRVLNAEEHDFKHVMLGFLMGVYKFTLGQEREQTHPFLVVESKRKAELKETMAIAQAIWTIRDLINIPANLLGPQELADKAQELLTPLGAQIDRITGALLQEHYPAIAAVGAGSDREACVFKAQWKGSTAPPDAPLIALAGKGVCFDTGGYDLKPSNAMLKMKKDMGGAALMIGLASLIMQQDWPIRMELRVGCVENSVSGHAMRPSDIIQTRKGLTVEIGNTDAEGRLVLCDLLAELSDLSPDLLIDAATLAGAARVALGPDLPALFSNNDDMAQLCMQQGFLHHDPLWRLPLWKDYEAWLESKSADTANVATNGMAGAISAALFLNKFVNPDIRWMHIDTYAWNDIERSGRPVGGDALALRTLYFMLQEYYNH